MIIGTSHTYESDLRLAMAAASSAALKDDLSSIRAELAEIERRAGAISIQRGWDTATKEQEGYFRFRIPFPESDSRIAERLILKQMKSIITLLRYRHRLQMHDHRADALLQKTTDCLQASIRILTQYL